MDIGDYMDRRKIDKGKRWRVVKFYSVIPQRQQESWPSIASIQSYISSEVVDKARRRKGKGLTLTVPVTTIDARQHFETG